MFSPPLGDDLLTRRIQVAVALFVDENNVRSEILKEYVARWLLGEPGPKPDESQWLTTRPAISWVPAMRASLLAAADHLTRC